MLNIYISLVFFFSHKSLLVHSFLYYMQADVSTFTQLVGLRSQKRKCFARNTSLFYFYSASTGMNENVVTSKSPVSVNLISGITIRDIKHKVITGSTLPQIPSSA